MGKESVKDVFLRCGVLLGRRNTEGQKTDFLRVAQKQLEQAGFPVDTTCVSASLMRRESVNMYNLYAGGFKRTDMVLITYYDMPLWQFYSKGRRASDANWSKGNLPLHTLLFLCCVITIVAFLHITVIPDLQKHGFMSLWGAVLVLVCLFGFYGIRHMRRGIAAGNTMVRNSSSLIALFALACDLFEREKQHIAFAMINEGTRSEYGLHMLQEYIGEKHTQQVYLDPIGNTGELQGFADRYVPEGPHKKLAGHVEWHDLVEDKHTYGDILLTSSSCDNGYVSLKIEKRTDSNDLEQQVIKVIQVLKTLMISCTP